MIAPNPIRALLVTVFLLMLGAVVARAQNDDFNFENIPVDEDQIPYIGVGAGYVNFLSIVNDPELNSVSQQLGLGDMGTTLLMHGGGGWTVVGLIPNVRLGVYGAGGSKSRSATYSVNGNDFQRTIRFHEGLTAADIDYVFPLFFRGFAITVGSMVGVSTHELTITQTQQNGVTFSDLLTRYQDTIPSTSARNRQTQISQSNLFFYPRIDFELAVSPFILLRAAAGWQLSANIGDWTDGEGTTIQSVPNIKPDGPMLHFGVFLGLFQK